MLRAAKLGIKKMLSLEKLIIFSVAVLPAYLIKIDFFGLPTNILELLEAAVIFWWYLDKKQKKLDTRELGQKYGKYLLAAGLIFAGLIASLVVNGNYRVGLGIIKSWFLLPMVFAFVAVNVVNTEEKIKNMLTTFYFSSAIVSSVALGYYFFNKLTYDGRLEAFFSSPNYLAMYLVPGLISGLLLVRNQKSETKRQKYNFEKFYYFGCVIIMASLYLTYSYAAWAAIIASLVIVEIIAKEKNILKSKIFWLSIVLAVLVFSGQWSSDKLRSAYTVSTRSSITSRLMIWKTAGELAHDNPFWGIGPGNFQNKYLEYQKFFPPYLEWAVPHPHNIWLAFFLYSGLAGIVGFSLLVFFWLRDVLKKEDSALKTIFLAIMLFTLLHGLADTTYFKNDLAVMFWLNFLALNLKKTS